MRSAERPAEGAPRIPSPPVPTRDVLAIVALWALSLLLVNPAADFPLNDDWSFGLAVKGFLEHGEFRPIDWTTMSLLTQALWGALFCLPAGFSFDALKVSTLVLSVVGIAGTYVLVRSQDRSRWLAAAAALTLAFNPIYLALSCSFMTDVPYTTLTLVAVLFLIRDLKRGSNADLAIGTALVVVTTLTRQLGVAIGAAFAVASVMRRGFSPGSIARALVPGAVSAAALFLLQRWLVAMDRLPTPLAKKTQDLVHALTAPQEVLVRSAKTAVVALLYLGWFLLPIAILLVAGWWWRRRAATSIALAAASGGLALGLGLRAWAERLPILMPLSENVIVPSGIGPLTLRDSFILGLDPVPALPQGIWVAITLAGVLGAGGLIAALGMRLSGWRGSLPRTAPTEADVVATFLLLTAAIGTLPVLMVGGFFDRYLVPTLPLVIAGLAVWSPEPPPGAGRAARWLAAGVLAGTAVFAICGAKDYLAWNRARWTALRDLVQAEAVAPGEIDGGYEYCGWVLYDPGFRQKPGHSWWWASGDRYLIAFGPVAGYRVTKTYSYQRWMPPGAGKVLVLKREGSD